MAPAAFKGTMGPVTAALSMAAGARSALPEAEVAMRPLSDGGNGLLEACRHLAGGRISERSVTGPLGTVVRAELLHQDGVVIAESAQACGLHLMPEARRDPLTATTRGVGELLLSAGETGADRVVLGLGGSGTVDGGTGMARALGWRFLDSEGRDLPEGGGSLERLATIEPPPDRERLPITALCDVDNPLTGPRGAAHVYAPQKGAEPREVKQLESGLRRLGDLLEAVVGISVSDLAGAGAAGGLGAGVRGFLGGELVSGADWMIDRAGLDEGLGSFELLVTGEGSYDAQSEMGKVTGRVVAMARSAGLLVLLACGQIEGVLPDDVRGLDGGGQVLTGDDLADLVAAGCSELSGGDTL